MSGFEVSGVSATCILGKISLPSGIRGNEQYLLDAVCRPLLKEHLTCSRYAWPGCQDLPYAVVPLDS